MAENSLELLRQARSKAAQLTETLKQRFADIERNPPDIPPEQLTAGREAMLNAIGAAERTRAALDEALREAEGTDRNEDDE